LSGLLGARVEQFHALDQPVNLLGEVGAGQATIWAETLEAQASDARVWMTYGSGEGWLAGKPAALTRQVGKGSVTYVGAWLDPALMRKVEERLLQDAGVEPIVPGLPADVEICERSGGAKRVWILINHGPTARTVRLPVQMKNVVVGSGSNNSLQLAGHDVSVVEVSTAESASK
jgi:beta-galactosidase